MNRNLLQQKTVAVKMTRHVVVFAVHGRIHVLGVLMSAGPGRQRFLEMLVEVLSSYFTEFKTLIWY